MLNLLKKYLRNFYDGNEAFLKVLRKQGATVGINVQIVDRKKFLYEPWCANLIEIQDEVVIAAGVRLVSHDSSYVNIVGDLPIKYGKITIEKNAYIGVNAVILPGVTIGKCSLIGAGAVVNRNIPPYTVAAGNPVKIISSLDEGLSKYKKRIAQADNNDVRYIDLGGSYSQMLDKYGKAVNNVIIEKYNKHFNIK